MVSIVKQKFIKETCVHNAHKIFCHYNSDLDYDEEDVSKFVEGIGYLADVLAKNGYLC